MNLSDLLIYITLFIALYFEIYMLILYLENRKEIKNNTQKENKDFFPSATVVVPCWNEEDTVEATLKSILNLNYPKDKLKIFVVDDGSTDRTPEIVKNFLEKNNKDGIIKFIQKENGGKHTAMNRALEEVETDLIGSLDADSFVDENALSRIAAHFKNENISAVTPVIKTLESKNIWAMVQKTEFIIASIVRKIFAFSGSIFITPGPFSIMRTSVVKEIGGWKKAHNTEDMEIGIRMQKENYIIENEERAIVYTKPLTTLKGLYKQRLRWVYGFLRNAMDYRFMFFDKKYGNLGVFFLPMSLISVILTTILFLLFVYRIIFEIFEIIYKWWIIGFDFSFPEKIDLFFIKTDPLFFIAILIIFVILILLYFAKIMINEKKIFTWDIPFYLILYGLVAPLWLVAALWKSIFKIESKWEDN